jgi:uncharacterized protein
MPDDQQDVIAFLKDPSSYGEDLGCVEMIETHVSLVFLAGDRAYKLKRAVKYPYLDFSTAERRRAACEAELALNRRTAPALYLEVRSIFRTAAGRLSFSPLGTVLDRVVVMRRFDQALLFDALAKSGGLTVQLMDELADHIAAFHAAAEPCFDRGSAAEMGEIAEIQHHCLVATRQAGFGSEEADTLLDKWRERLAAVAATLDRRRAAGRVRRCHGDLHPRNICLFDGKPTLFDCLEFDDALAIIDVLYDLAFLLMDLEHRRLPQFANRLMNRYLDRSGEDGGLPALPLFLSLRAGIRAHVTASAAERFSEATAKAEMITEARRYLDLAHRLLRPAPCRLVAIGGVTRQVYDALRRKAATALAAGYSAVIDAVALRPEERSSFAEVAQAAGVPFTGLWLEAPSAKMAERIRARRHDASDASVEVLAEQLRHDPGPMDWLRIDAGGGPADCLDAARVALAAG